MFETLFQYPARVFAKGEFLFLSPAPPWLLAVAILLAAGGLALLNFRSSGASRVNRRQRTAIWALEALTAALLLVILWQPALRVSSLRPRQNIVAVVVDDSRSMSLADEGPRRIDAAARVLNDGLLQGLSDRFQVRLYRAGRKLERIPGSAELTANQIATRLGETLRQAVAESATLPIGAIVLLSDGADNTGGIDLASLTDVRQRRIPVHTIGFGREQMGKDAELTGVELPARAVKGSKIAVQASFRQRGFSGGKARLLARSAGKTLASREVALRADGEAQTETLLVNAGEPGPQTIEVAIEGLEGEENPGNNALRRLVSVASARPRILYLEGEPKWDYKFLRRAMDDDRSVDFVSILRTTQNKIYRQGVANPQELEQGFPARAGELFTYQGLVIGGVEASYFTPAQQEAIRLFADRRGGGVLFLAGRAGLSDGGYASSPFAEILPVSLPDRKNTFKREPANAELTPAGRESAILRLEDSAERNAERWKKLPHLANYQEVGAAKPGAVVLAEAIPTSKGRFPLLATQAYGRGHVAMLATGGTWRWRMWQESTDTSHATFWQQLMRWLVSDTPSAVAGSTPRQVLSDDTRVELRGEVRDKLYSPVSDAMVEARVSGPGGLSATIPLPLEALSQGVYTAEWTAEKPGSYLVDLVATRGGQELGRDTIHFRREDGVAENFAVEQNRELLTKLSAETGGSYYRPANASKLLDEITFSEAGMTVKENFDLWNMPIVFLLLMALMAAEWLLRRRWGAV
jgi:uncharacterized membrane protein